MSAAPIAGRGARRSDPHSARRRRSRRARPVFALAAIAFVAGAIVGAEASGSSTAPTLAAHFAAAWARGDYAAMYGELATSSQRAVSPAEFAAVYREAAMLATATGERVTGSPRAAAGGVEVVPVRVRTRLFGTLSSSFRLPIVASERRSGIAGVVVALARLPGHAAGRAAEPAHELAGARVAAGARRLGARRRPGDRGGAAQLAAGRRGERGRRRGRARSRRTAWRNWRRRACRPTRSSASAAWSSPTTNACGARRGASCWRANGCWRARARARATAVRTSISPTVQRAAVTALGGQYGGVVAMEAATGQILGVAGVGLEALQPPGSTFKMVTVTGVLQAGVANPRTTFPYATSATLDGVQLNNSERRVLRRDADARVRGVVQLGVRAARGQAGGGAAGGDGGTLRLQPLARGRGRGGEHDPAGRADPGRTGGRARRRSARTRCWRPRWRWPSWRRRSPTAAGGRRRASAFRSGGGGPAQAARPEHERRRGRAQCSRER